MGDLVDFMQQKLNSDLFTACEQNSPDEAAILLAEGADIDARNTDGWTPLIEAAFRGHLKLVEFLLARGANVLAKDEQGWTARMWALDCGYDQIAKILVKPEEDQTAILNHSLFKAVEEGQHEHAVNLLNEGASVNARGDLDHNYNPLLIEAYQKGHLNVMKLLLSRGADPNAGDIEDITALMWASHYGDLKTVKLLLDSGADVNAIDEDGRTALMHAVPRDHLEVVRLLLERGAKHPDRP